METNKIYNENCLDTMAKMPDNFIDLTVTSPPYNLGVKHHTGNNIFKAYDEYIDDMPEDELRPREMVNEVLTGRRKTHYGLKFEYDEAHRR